MKNSSDIMGNLTRDLPDCSAVPQTTAPPHIPSLNFTLTFFNYKTSDILSNSILILTLPKLWPCGPVWSRTQNLITL